MTGAREQQTGTAAERMERLRRAVGADDAGSIRERTLIVLAHPDDEALMLGARLARFLEATLVHVTDGAPRSGVDQRAHGFATPEQYRDAREAELRAMLTMAGAEAMPRRCLGVADQGAGMALTEITREIGELLRVLQPEVVMTHAYEGGHPDHDACAFAVQAAVRRMDGVRPMVVEGTFYHAGAGGTVTDAFLSTTEARATCVCRLGEAEQVRKRGLLACFTTQAETLRQFPVEAERFREAPAYDFSRPPHTGELFYERFAWGMRGEEFCRLAAAAESALGGVDLCAY